MTEIRALIAQIDELAAIQRFSAPHTRWLARTLRVLEQVFGQASRYYLTIANLNWSDTGPALLSPFGIEQAIEARHQGAYVRQLDSAKGMLLAALDELTSGELDDVYIGKDTPRESSGIIKLIRLMENKLRKVVRVPPTREREVQDAVENLLIGADIEYSRESPLIEYSSKNYVPDFSMAKLDLVLEVKLCAKEGREKVIIAEINDDILAYRTQFGNLLFVIYDLGHIRDVDRFGEQFETHEGVLVRVVKH